MNRLIAMFLCCAALAFGETEKDSRVGAGGVIFGEDFAFAFVIGAPPGWIFDTQSALAIGSRVVIYPEGSDLANTGVWISANAFPLGGLSLERWMDQDKSALETDFPGLIVKDYPNLLTGDTLIALVRGWEPGSSDYELIERAAYIRIGQHVAIISLSAITKEAFNESLEAFAYVVRGFSNFKELLHKEQN